MCPEGRCEPQPTLGFWQELWPVRGTHAGADFLVRPCSGLTLEQSMPEGLHPMERTHAAEVPEVLQLMGRTHIEKVH